MKAVGTLFGLLVAVGIAYIILQTYPDLQRYMRIRSM